MNTFDLFSLKGRNVLITGGRAMYGKGATLALADAGANKLPKAWAHCKKPPLL